MKKPFFALGVLALVASGAFASIASGADHRDSPNNTANPTSDINDVYAFRSPENANNLVVAISVNPLIAPSDNATRGKFDANVQYQVHIDRNGDLADDVTLNLRMTSLGDALTIEGMGGPITAAITQPGAASAVVTNQGGVKVFAGLRDDPFFFDLAGFAAFIANPQAPARGLRPASAGAPADTFAGTNILAIVIEAPITAVSGGSSANSGTIKAWVSTTKGGARLDRMAIPAVNTALIPTAQKEAFNQGNPINDAATFGAAATNQITGLRNAVDPLFGGPTTQDGGPLGGLSAAMVSAALIPDVVTIDFSKAVQFPNGRRLQDDVIDAALGVVLNRGGAAGISDGVNANDKPFGNAFPYLADPHTPAAPAAGATPAVRPPSTGDAGLFDDAGAMWTLSAGLFVLAIAFGGAGVMAALRSRSR